MFNKREVIGIGSDHAGFALKTHIIKVLTLDNYIFKDFGTYSDISVDYPDIAHPLANEISNCIISFGILICGSANGITMTANKHKDVRAAICWTEEIAKLARLHNDANILSLPGRFLDFNIAVDITKIFFETSFEGGRHQLRVNKINC